MPPLKYVTLFNSRLICLAASPSVLLTRSSQALLPTSGYCCSCPCSRTRPIRCHLLLASATHSFMVVFLPHVCVIVLRHLSCFWASGTAVEPRSSTEVCLTWGGPCRNRHQCQAPASIRAFLVKVTPAALIIFLPWALPHAQVPPHHPSLSEGGFPEQEQPPPRVGPHRDGCVQTHHVTSHFLLVWRSRQRLEDVEAHCCQACHEGRRGMERWTYFPTVARETCGRVGN